MDEKSGQISKDTFNDIPELLFVYINAEEYQDPEWRVVQVYDGPILSRDKLLEIVRKKESKVPDYRALRRLLASCSRRLH